MTRDALNDSQCGWTQTPNAEPIQSRRVSSASQVSRFSDSPRMVTQRQAIDSILGSSAQGGAAMFDQDVNRPHEVVRGRRADCGKLGKLAQLSRSQRKRRKWSERQALLARARRAGVTSRGVKARHRRKPVGTLGEMVSGRKIDVDFEQHQSQGTLLGTLFHENYVHAANQRNYELGLTSETSAAEDHDILTNAGGGNVQPGNMSNTDYWSQAGESTRALLRGGIYMDNAQDFIG